MNEVVSKFSSYNIFNYLVPGTVFCLLLQERHLLSFDQIDVAVRLVVFYVVGMALSRAGSLILDPLLKRAGLIPRSNFTDYVQACATDKTVPTLLETSNTYRTMTSASFLGATIYAASLLLPTSWLKHDALGCLLVAAFGALFLFAYIKQNRAVTRRVRANIRLSPVPPAPAPIQEIAA